MFSAIKKLSVAVVIRAFSVVPYSWGVALSRILGRIAYALGASQRKSVEANLKLLWPNSRLDPAKLALLLARHIVLSTFECIKIAAGRFPEERIRIVNETMLTTALTSKRGIVVMSAHLGNFFVLAVILGRFAGTRAYLARDPQSPAGSMRRLMRSVWEKQLKNLGWLPIRSGIGGGLAAMKHVKAGNLLVVLEDVPRSVRKGVSLFNERFMISPAGMRLAQHAGATLLAVFTFRAEDGSHIVLVESFTASLSDGGCATQVPVFVVQLQNCIQSHPDQWIWYRPFPAHFSAQ